MEIHKIVLTVIGFDGLGADGVRDTLENTKYPNRCISQDILSIETSDIGEWSDDHTLNKHSTAQAEIDRLFNQPTKDQA